jgi:hypothetical protein
MKQEFFDNKNVGATSMSKHASLKTCTDFLSIFFVLAFLACPWWMYIDALNAGPPYKGTLTPLLAFCAVAPLFFFGFFWLAFRHYQSLQKKFPRFVRGYVVALALVALLGIPFNLIKHIGD